MGWPYLASSLLPLPQPVVWEPPGGGFKIPRVGENPPPPFPSVLTQVLSPPHPFPLTAASAFSIVPGTGRSFRAAFAHTSWAVQRLDSPGKAATAVGLQWVPLPCLVPGSRHGEVNHNAHRILPLSQLNPDPMQATAGRNSSEASLPWDSRESRSRRHGKRRKGHD